MPNGVLPYLSTSSNGKRGTVGFFSVFLFAILSSKDNSKDGNNNKLESIANSKVIETKPPNAFVPPKLDMVKTKKPKNNTIEV